MRWSDESWAATGDACDGARNGLRAGPGTCVGLLVTLLLAGFAWWIVFVVTTDQPLDFNVYYLAAEAYARGGDPYALSDAYPSPEWDALAAELGITHYAKPYRYPPHTAVLVMALRPLGPTGAVIVWSALNAAAMIAAAWLLGLALGGRRWLLLSLAALLLFAPAYDTLMMGQVNGLLFLSMAAALWLLARGRSASAGVWLATGGVLKLIPFLLLPYLALRGRGRLAAGVMLASLALTAICLPFVGWSGTIAYLENAVGLTRPGSVFSGQMNQTLTGVLGRMLAPAPARALAAIAGSALLGMTALVCWPRGERQRWLLLEFSVVIAALGLVFPFTWYHQLLVLLIPFLVVIQELVGRRRHGLLALVVALYALTSLHFLIWSSVAWLPYRGTGADAFAAFPFLFGLCLWALGGVMLASAKWPRAREVPERLRR